ncbi:hypothetical protein NGTWS0302_26770 [Mycolicibacterium cyprinidarum]|uniref:UmuC domain-containing protein n=1 Tax=Mycolicibacterium cyprinidarum TaxID=2860311 RepID=A0ABQ4VBG0_9MYCO|nr:hypothetical protein NGTWS0302_26770 [Mycolicibacterium sp. NGTWS0302]GJF17914.1 hypothetical protein NGTWS1702_25050 [Mycolicibacterium sp. NGTWSNA01]
MRQPESSTVNLGDSIVSQLLEQLEALCHTGGTQRASFGIQIAFGYNAGRSRDGRQFRLRKLVAPNGSAKAMPAEPSAVLTSATGPSLRDVLSRSPNEVTTVISFRACSIVIAKRTRMFGSLTR